MSKAQISDKQEVFCRKYLELHRSPEKAAVAAGYKASYARHLLGKPHILDRIRELDKSAAARSTISAGRIIEEMASIAFTNITDVIELEDDGRLVIKATGDLPEPVKRSIKKIKIRERTIMGREDNPDVLERHVEVEMHDKLRGLDQLAQVYDLYRPGGTGDDDDDRAAPFGGLNIIGPGEKRKAKGPPMIEGTATETEGDEDDER